MRLISRIADGFSEIIDELGPVVNMRFLWEDRFFTVEPEHIKVREIDAQTGFGHLLDGHYSKLILATDFNNYVKGEYCFVFRLLFESHRYT